MATSRTRTVHVHGTIRPVTVTTYDALGRVLTVAAGQTPSTSTCGTNPLPGNIPTQMTYVYDDFSRKLKETDPLNRTWVFTYDLQGNPLTVTDPKGQVTTATYGYGHQLLTRTAQAAPESSLKALARATRGTTDTYLPVFRGGLCVADGIGTCVGSDLRAEAGIGVQLGYLKRNNDAGTQAAYRGPVCYSDPTGTCTGWSLSTTVNGAPVGYLSTTNPNTPAGAIPAFVQSTAANILLQGVTGGTAYYVWQNKSGSDRVDHFFYAAPETLPPGYTDESVIGYVLTSAGTGTKQLKRYVNATGAHFYTADPAGDPPPGGFTAETADLGYLESSSANGGVALTRYYNATTQDYVLDTSPVAPTGYTTQAILGYLRPTGAGTTGIVTAYTRNALGQMVQASNPTVTYTYSHDAAHRLQSVTDSCGPKRLSYTYTQAGRLTSMTDTDGGRTDYSYDAVGRLSGIWAPNNDLVSFAYDAGGRLTEKWFPNGVNTRYTYNPDNTLARVLNRSGLSNATVLSQHDYAYDGVGNRVTHLERIGATTTPYKYLYDPLDRLLEVRNSATEALIESYAYDPLGNRKARVVGANTYSFFYDSVNQLTKYCLNDSVCNTPTWTFTYDNSGNLLTRTDTPAATNYAYDAENRLVSVTTAGQQDQLYAYDHEGRRVRKTVGGTVTNYVYDGPDIVAEYTNWVSPNARYTHGPALDDPLIRATASGTQFYHQDGLGSVIGVTNPTGGTDATARYDAWGMKVGGTGTIPQYGYTGREPDDPTGLIYYRARYYDPTLGRFTQRDPIGFESGDINLYAYVGGNPTNFVDPTGECIPLCLVAAIPVLKAVGVGIASSVAIGGAIRALLPGARVLDTRAILTDAAFGAAGVGVAAGISKLRQLPALARGAERALEARSTLAASGSRVGQGRNVAIAEGKISRQAISAKAVSGQARF